MRPANQEHSSEWGKITIARMGVAPKEVNITGDETTVAEALRCGGFELLSGESVFVDGVTARLEDFVEDGDYLQITGNKAGGNDEPEADTDDVNVDTTEETDENA
jgi:hypothetical protein